MPHPKNRFDNKENNIEHTFHSLKGELQEALAIYWETAAAVLGKGSIQLLEPHPGYFAMEGNFFSSLFLYSYFRAGIPKSRRIFYTIVNQCLRGMVTGCDNILDNEYKMTLATDLPLDAGKFRSIVDIMVSDRILFFILQREFLLHHLTSEQVMAASYESLRALSKSGVQEASEEQGAGSILNPREILSKIHSIKTGILFQSPWALPDLLENRDIMGSEFVTHGEGVKAALFKIGMGCQILDDMVDLYLDLKMNRHNYVASLIQYGEDRKETALFRKILKGRIDIETSEDLISQFPSACKTASRKALEYLKSGTADLFLPEHRFMVDVSIQMIAKRIGADVFLFKFL